MFSMWCCFPHEALPGQSLDPELTLPIFYPQQTPFSAAWVQEGGVSCIPGLAWQAFPYWHARPNVFLSLLLVEHKDKVSLA